jgi:hypothetical protein
MEQDLYEQHDPDPPLPPAEPEQAAEKPEKVDRRRRSGPAPSAAAERQRRKRDRDKAAAAPPRPAPTVAADAADKTAGQVALTLNDLSPEQKRAREVMLGYMTLGWTQATAKLLGMPLARPADPAGAAAFDQLAATRPDVAMSAMQWDAWLTSFDVVAIKRGWYAELPAEWALVVSSLALAGCVVGVWFTNRAQAAREQQRAAQEQQAQEEQAQPATEAQSMA